MKITRQYLKAFSLSVHL